MRLEFDSKAAAEARQAEIHAYMISSNKDYAASVAAGQTVRWAVPRQDVDENGKPIGAKWHIPIKDRALGALTTTERSKV